MHTSTTPVEAATASVPLAPENATKEEVMQALKGVLMEVADKTGEKVAIAPIKLLQHESLDTSLLRGSIESVRQIPEEANDDVRHWLQHMHFEKVTIYDARTLVPRALRGFAALSNPSNTSFQKQAKGMFTMIPLLR
jgi:hypothetical protein